MWQLRKNIIDTFDGRESEGYYVVDIGITIDNEKGYNRIVTEYRPEIPIHILIIRQWEFLLLPLFNIIENFKITMMANTFDDIITCSYKEYHQIILNYNNLSHHSSCEAEDWLKMYLYVLLDYKTKCFVRIL